MCYWYNLSNKQAHKLFLINGAKKFPKQLTAGRIISLSRETFADVSIFFQTLLFDFLVHSNS